MTGAQKLDFLVHCQSTKLRNYQNLTAPFSTFYNYHNILLQHATLVSDNRALNYSAGYQQVPKHNYMICTQVR